MTPMIENLDTKEVLIGLMEEKEKLSLMGSGNNLATTSWEERKALQPRRRSSDAFE